MMDINDILPQQYLDLGFEITGFAGTALILKYRRKTIFVLSSGWNLRDGLISKLCEIYLKHRLGITSPEHTKEAFSYMK